MKLWPHTSTRAAKHLSREPSSSGKPRTSEAIESDSHFAILRVITLIPKFSRLSVVPSHPLCFLNTHGDTKEIKTCRDYWNPPDTQDSCRCNFSLSLLQDLGLTSEISKVPTFIVRAFSFLPGLKICPHYFLHVRNVLFYYFIEYMF